MVDNRVQQRVDFYMAVAIWNSNTGEQARLSGQGAEDAEELPRHAGNAGKLVHCSMPHCKGADARFGPNTFKRKLPGKCPSIKQAPLALYLSEKINENSLVDAHFRFN